ncbi:hypothetical protein MMC19_001986 [Ptychographa xylographoides]|nr:hypothetical protein [Ptychographa xylographoides]
MATQQTQTQASSKDHWTAQAYTTSASFVPRLTSTIVAWLAPQPADRILDLGCGDGLLTAQIKERCASVVGIDASPKMIGAAKEAYGSSEDLSWEVVDCRFLEAWVKGKGKGKGRAGGYTKTGGTFVFEMGGAGNVAEVHAALIAAIVHQGVGIEEARAKSPWFFPSEQSMKDMLKEAGFEVEKSELVYRPTQLTTEKDGGVKGWVELMGARFFEGLSDERREGAVKEVCDVLETVLTHEEDRSKWLGYVRLRVLARRV